MATIKGLHAFLIKEQFRKTLQAKGYAFFGLENKAAYNVNIIGVRSDEDIFNKLGTEREIGKSAPIPSQQTQVRFGKKSR